MQVEITTNMGSFAPIAFIATLVVVTCIIGFFVSKHAQMPVRLLSPVLLTAIISILFLIYRIVTDGYLIKDEESWHMDGLLVTDYMSGQVSTLEGRLSSGKEGYAWLVGFIYAITGPAPFVLIVVNILLTILLIPIWVQITFITASEVGFSSEQIVRAAKFSSYGMVLCPVILFWVPRVLREVPSMFLIASAVLFFLRFLVWRNYHSLFFTLVAVASMITVRAQIGLGLISAILVSLVIIWSRKIKSRTARVVTLLPVITGCLFLTWAVIRDSAGLSIASAIRRNRSLTNATSAFSGAEDLEESASIIDIIMFNLPRVLLGPFPHELNFSSVMILATVSNVFWLLVLLASSQVLFRPGKFGQKHEAWTPLVVLLVFSLMLIAALSVTAGNYGLVTRMRLMPLAVLIPLAALGATLVVHTASTKLRKVEHRHSKQRQVLGLN